MWRELCHTFTTYTQCRPTVPLPSSVSQLTWPACCHMKRGSLADGILHLVRSSAGAVGPQPKKTCDAPPGGASTRLLGRSLRKLPTCSTLHSSSMNTKSPQQAHTKQVHTNNSVHLHALQSIQGRFYVPSASAACGVQSATHLLTTLTFWPSERL
jgi:hypothetical protein